MIVPPPSTSLAKRALTAVALSVGFYLLAGTIAGVLLYIPYVEAKSADGRQPQLLILWLAAGAIIWSIIPRADRFEAPGARIDADSQPHLVAIVDKVAEATGQAKPAEIYLVREMNAWVSSRGGLMGFGSRRIMGIGLPILQQLTVSQLQGVLAHEFGHYHGGDVALGPWIYRTRAAIGRTVMTLTGSGVALIHMIHKPFVWYGSFFLQFTQAISRHQELDADALAARLVGHESVTSGLKAVHSGTAAFDLYWRRAVVPVLVAGYRPPLADGFALFRSAPKLADKLEAFVAESLKKDETNPFDSHPSMRERLARIEAMREGGEFSAPFLTPDERPAIQLVRDTDRVEVELLRAIASDPESVPALKSIEWNRVGRSVSLETWRRQTREAAAAFGPMTPATAPTDLSGLEALGRRILRTRARAGGAPRDALAVHAAGAIAAAAACKLAGMGWSIEAMPGQPVILRRGDAELRPFSVMFGLVRGKSSPAEWTALHSAGGISDWPLAVPVEMMRPS
jgi:heat shock protein HtpX